MKELCASYSVSDLAWVRVHAVFTVYVGTNDRLP